jgi:transcription antitermination factor NusG
MTRKEWYAVRVRPKGEVRASGELSARGFEAFLPTWHVRRRWSDRVKALEVPVFPGYLFCRFQLSERGRVLDAPAVIQILGIGGTPIPVSDTEIEAIQTLVTSHVTVTPWPYLRSGNRVRINYGPLAGIDGIVAKAEDGRSRVVVSVTLLQRSVAAEIERDWVDLIC